MEDFIEERNKAFAACLAPTLAYLGLLMALGLVGNTLAFLIYYWRFKPSVTRTYILAMSVCDLMTNCLALPSDIYEIRFHYDFDDDAGCKFFGFITRFLALQTASILIAIAVDRRRKICQLMRTPRTPKHVYVELTFLAVFMACLAAPFSALKGLQSLSVDGSNVTGSTCFINDEHIGSLFYTIYNASMGLGFIICVTIMSVCYILIARHLWLHKKSLLRNAKKRQTQHQDRRQIQSKPHEGKKAADLVEHGQDQEPVSDSASASTTEQLEDEEENLHLSTGKPHTSITDDTEQTSVMSELENAAESGVLASTLTSSLQAESSFQCEMRSFSPDDSTGDFNPETECGQVQETVPSSPVRPFRGVAIINTSDRDHRNPSNTAGRPQLNEGKQVTTRKLTTIIRSSKQMPRRTTLMMFILAAMFVVSYLPYLSVAGLYRGRERAGVECWQQNLGQIAIRSFFINSAINPLVYSFCSIRFRRECCRLLRCRK